MMNRATCVLLVMLRLAIGWHLLYEGWYKLNKEEWTAEHYLRASSGPAAPIFRKIIGDSAEAPVENMLTPAGDLRTIDAGNVDPAGLFPEDLAVAWDAWFDDFVDHYQLNGEQKAKATVSYKTQKQEFVRWLKSNRTAVKKASASGAAPVELNLTMAERLNALESKQKEIKDFEDGDYQRKAGTLWEKDAKAELARLRTEYDQMRAELSRDLQAQTRKMQDELDTIVTAEQRSTHGPMTGPLLVSSPGKSKFLKLVNYWVPRGLFVIGALLMLGLLTRTSCVLGGLLLLSFYIAMPPLPGSPPNPMSEGNYLVINKTLIEVIALFVLATTRVGQWGGLDGLVRFVTTKKPSGETATR